MTTNGVQNWAFPNRFAIRMNIFPKEKVLVANGSKAHTCGYNWQNSNLSEEYLEALRSQVMNVWHHLVESMKKVVEEPDLLESEWEEDMDDLDRFDWQLDALKRCVDEGTPFVDTMFQPGWKGWKGSSVATP
ncbi:expressed unknown protein [Seminavis robusta]|uniref:Uncharacterized protein n=1 Tax=Seminavis robusta TaxID=568900 RepID=A0A9N8HR63_9STRA|nr:expressed unknown protein [Seminavis robusta]|eukprot:Sro1049_g235340.1 n/a (132) ;mRNA; f:9010-9611